VQIQTHTEHKEKSYWCNWFSRSPHGKAAVLNIGFVLCALMGVCGAWDSSGLGWGWESKWVLLVFGILYFLDCITCKTARFMYNINWLEDVWTYVQKVGCLLSVRPSAIR
jgi:hypothetical protein